MKNNANSSYAKMFKEKKSKEPKMILNSKSDRPNLGLVFDDLEDWDNMIQSQKDKNQINQNQDDITGNYTQNKNNNLSPSSNNCNNLGLQDLSLNTSTFTYKVNEMGKVDKIDLSSQEDLNYGLMNNIHKKIYFGGDNMISQINPNNYNNNINLNNGSFHVIKEELDEYKNFSKISNNNNDYEKDSLNSEDDNKETSHQYLQNNINKNIEIISTNNNIVNNIKNNNTDGKYDIEPENKNYYQDIMNNEEDENELAQQQMNDLIADIQNKNNKETITTSYGQAAATGHFGKKIQNPSIPKPISGKKNKPDSAKNNQKEKIPSASNQKIQNQVIQQPTTTDIQQIPTTTVISNPVVHQISNPAIQNMPGTIIQQIPTTINSNFQNQDVKTVTFGKMPQGNNSPEIFNNNNCNIISPNYPQNNIIPPQNQPINMIPNFINPQQMQGYGNIIPIQNCQINQNYPCPPIQPIPFQHPMQFYPNPQNMIPIMPINPGGIMFQHPQIITNPPKEDKKDKKDNKKKVIYKPKSMQEYRLKYINVKPVKVGGLGPNIGTKEWVEKKEKKKKEKEYSEKVKNINKDISEHKEHLKVVSNNTSKMEINDNLEPNIKENLKLNENHKQNLNQNFNQNKNDIKNQLYDSLNEDDFENQKIKEKDFIPLTRGKTAPMEKNQETNSNESYSHINMLKKLKSQNQSANNNNKNQSSEKLKIKKINKKDKSFIDASKQDEKKKGKIYTTLKPIFINKNKKRPQSSKIRLQPIPKNSPSSKLIVKHNSNGEDEMTKLFMQNKPNEYNGVGYIDKQKEEDNQPVNFENDELNDLFQKHLNLNNKIDKIKDFLKNKK